MKKQIFSVVEGRGRLLLVAVCLSIGLGAIAVGALGSFGKARHFAVGPGPDSVAIGDFNGDHRRDLAVANLYGHNVSVLLGRGNGTFGAKKSFPAETAPSSLAIGDFNGDRRQDIVVANSGSGNVSILLGRGNGTFGPMAAYAVDYGANAVAIGDFNGDHRPDLAVATSFSESVSILLGHGDGSFGESMGVATHYPVGLDPDSVAIGDFNGDNRPDLAVANLFSHTISVLLGKGDGTFGVATNFPAGTSPTSVAIGDLNRDNKLDLAVADPIAPYGPGPTNQMPSGHVSVLLGKGDGTFGAQTEFPVSRGKSPHPGTGSSAVAIGDLNGDHKPDLIVTLARPTRSGKVAILRGKGNGTFAAPVSLGTGTQPVCTVAERRTGKCPPASVTIGKLNGGSAPDIAVTNFGTNRVTVLLNGGPQPGGRRFESALLPPMDEGPAVRRRSHAGPSGESKAR